MEDKLETADPVPETTESAETAAQMESAAFEMPYLLSMTGEKVDETVVVMLTIDYRIPLQAAPTLKITPHGDTVITNQPLTQTLDIPTEIGTVTKEIRLTGTNPGIDVSVSQTSEGFGIEVHETWPNPMEPKSIAPRPTETPLPAVIEVEGNEITHGIDVK